YNLGSGFVSTFENGRLVRSTLATDEYIFPLGELNNGLKFRPLTISPEDAAANQFEAAMLYDDASNYGYSTSTLAADVQNVNPYFFHFVKQTQGASNAALKVFWDGGVEGNFDEIAEWQNQWQAIYQDANGSDLNLAYLAKTTWQYDGNDPVILANKKDETDDLYGIPNAFAPNGAQSENTSFGIINQKGLVQLVSMQIFDRWGTKVFDSQREGVETWNGYYNGKIQSAGNYSYLINLKRTNGETIAPIAGNVLLIW
ncbi:MAG: gliding motility-associated C-terminal domain-containing protein, partial [Chitinophagales bacterium]|nr:gliding motility-associated C-terminal domain-containing protein [Chitinophagales bacterium]